MSRCYDECDDFVCEERLREGWISFVDEADLRL